MAEEYEFQDRADGKKYRRVVRPQGHARRYDEDWEELPKDKLTYKSHGEDAAPPEGESAHAKMMRAAAARRRAQQEGAKAALAGK
jgi:hypothetical protein